MILFSIQFQGFIQVRCVQVCKLYFTKFEKKYLKNLIVMFLVYTLHLRWKSDLRHTVWQASQLFTDVFIENILKQGYDEAPGTINSKMRLTRTQGQTDVKDEIVKQIWRILHHTKRSSTDHGWQLKIDSQAQRLHHQKWLLN